MRIRASIPIAFYVTGASADALSPVFRFKCWRCEVNAAWDGDEPLELPNSGGADPWFRRVQSLNIEIDEPDPGRIAQAVASDDPLQIARCIIKPANLVIRSIRNFGLVPHLREYRLDEFAGDRWLELFNVESSQDAGVSWTRLRQPPEDLVEMLARQAMLKREPIGHLSVSALRGVRAAIEDRMTAGPEREFLTNAIENLRLGNFRVAVVESVMCLEILLGQLLPELLAARSVHGDALTKDITLYPRVKILLPLLMPQEIATVDMVAVLRTISLRNKIVHQHGNLPPGIPEITVRQGISAVLVLSQVLATKQQALKRAPELREIASRVAHEHDVRAPTIDWSPEHMFTVRFPFFFDRVPNRNQLPSIAKAVLDRLVEHDPRCQPETDVAVFFSHFGKDIATWKRGTFVEIPGPVPNPFGPPATD